MIGTWSGYYKYKRAASQKAIGFDKTLFTITINSLDKGIFKGTVIDDFKSGGMEGTGQIIGEIHGDTVTFKKLMPRELIVYRNGERKYTDKSHPTLYYKGTISTDKTEISGKWKFGITIGLLLGFIPLPYRPGKGTWKMTLQ